MSLVDVALVAFVGCLKYVESISPVETIQNANSPRKKLVLKTPADP